ncbi:hypothetical protein [Janthinobacterium sp. 1_2014MBL_MicDiv]|uniref:hypothetical protein n=1 Tax=Janthinobacterium sp. 1_2014MBL_MicDiv TaxID=1644131 RepID=UPI0008F4A3D0|nr:hypothetical protein [Janthinobacterium sp. 1_2014MBL_MicDiv]APA69904.1 hypothetical protein YQ44_21290 [Janthinobacterium sp. 1_2014MBL_MicDiv]
MENTLHATSHADQSMAPATPRPALQQCVVPVAPACFLLQASAGACIDALSYSVHQIAKTYHAFGAANITFIISDANALNVAGFFTPAHQRVLVGGIPIELHYMFATEQGVRHSNGSSRTLSYWAEYFSKQEAR